MINERIGGERAQLIDQLTPELGRERCAYPDVMEPAIVVVQTEQQRADALTVLVDPESGDRTLGGALVLDLDQAALVGGCRRRRVVWPSRHPARPLRSG